MDMNVSHMIFTSIKLHMCGEKDFQEGEKYSKAEKIAKKPNLMSSCE